MPNFSLSANGATFIKEREGFALKFYADSEGYPTVGWGHLITKKYTYAKNPSGVASKGYLTQAQANALSSSLGLNYTSPISQTKANNFFATDTATAIAAVNRLPVPSGHNFSQSQFDALVSLAFNGGPGVLNTKDVRALIAHNQIYPTFSGPLSVSELDTCSKLVSRAFSYDKNLKTRRNAEAILFCKGRAYTHKYPVYSL